MTRFSFNPFHKLGFSRSPQSFRELIIEQQRRIDEITASIQRAEGYLTTHSDSKPVTWRLSTLRKDHDRAYRDLAKSERRLVELLEALKG